MNLTKPERMLVSQIVNVKLDNATLKDHIMLEGVYKVVRPEDIRLPVPPDFVSEEDKEIFDKYDGMKIDSIGNEDHKIKIQEAFKKSREEQNKFWANSGEDEVEINFSDEQKKVILDFFEQDKRVWPREYHKAILDLHNKLSGKSE
jgi:hypothetical protein